MTDQENTQQEPTMEEILASIRRIISEDNDDAAKAPASNGAGLASAAAPAQPAPLEAPAPLAAAPAAPSAPMGAPMRAPPPANNGMHSGTSADVLELTQAQVLPDHEPAQPAHQPQDPSAFHQPAPEPAESMAEAAPAQDEFAGSDLMVVDGEEGESHEEVGNGALISNDTEENATEAFRALNRDVAISRAASGGQTLETMVEDMMRPMLKNWLDDNLGEIVEDVVEREVRRIADRSRSR